MTPQPTENRFANKADVTALLGAFCLFLSAVEYMLPKPMPFMRLGIANLPILLAVDLLPFPWFLVLALVKVVGMSVISGTLFSFIALFSLLGTLTAALVMWGARKAGGRHITQIGVSILGALTSNAAQIFIARYLIFGQAAWLIAPLFLAMGLATGTALGIFAEHFAWRSRWYAMALGRPYQGPKGEDGPALEKKQAPLAKKAGVEARMRRRQRFEAYFSPWSAAAGGAALALIFLFERNLAVKVGLFAFFIFAVLMAGKKFSFLTMVAVSSGIVLTNLLVPSGKVLGRLGPLVVTQYALTEGIIKALTFEGLMLISKASIMPGLKLPGRFGTIVASSFLYYDRIVEYKGRIRAATLSRDADDMMTGVWESLNADSAWAQVARPRFTAAPKARAGYLILSICVFAAGLAAFLAR